MVLHGINPVLVQNGTVRVPLPRASINTWSIIGVLLVGPLKLDICMLFTVLYQYYSQERVLILGVSLEYFWLELSAWRKYHKIFDGLSAGELGYLRLFRQPIPPVNHDTEEEDCSRTEQVYGSTI